MKASPKSNMWQAVDDYLDSIGHRLDKDFDIRKLSGGSANLNYLISMDGQKAVLRRPPDGPLPPGANDVAREYKVLSRLGDAYPPAPSGLVFCDDDSVIGVPFCISQFREGICIGRHLPEALARRPQIGHALSDLLVDALAPLHRVDVDAVGLAGLGNAEGFLERQIAGWYKRGQRVLSEPQQQLLAWVRDWLSAHLPERRPASLVHNDFKLDNMLIDPLTLRVNGVVDWDMCTIGDPLFELAILLSYWGGENDTPLYSAQCRMPCEADGWWPRQQVIKRYLDLMELSVTEQDLCFYWWLAQYRSVVVYAQLNIQFQRTGERPSASTLTEFDSIDELVGQMLLEMTENIDRVPDQLKLVA